MALGCATGITAAVVGVRPRASRSSRFAQVRQWPALFPVCVLFAQRIRVSIPAQGERVGEHKSDWSCGDNDYLGAARHSAPPPEVSSPAVGSSWVIESTSYPPSSNERPGSATLLWHRSPVRSGPRVRPGWTHCPRCWVGADHPTLEPTRVGSSGQSQADDPACRICWSSIFSHRRTCRVAFRGWGSCCWATAALLGARASPCRLSCRRPSIVSSSSDA